MKNSQYTHAKPRCLLAINCVVVLILGFTACAKLWIQPPRSQANLEALERVEIKSYRFEQAGGIDMEYGLYIPTEYRPNNPTPLVVALHGYGSGVMYMMEYNNLVELAEQYGYLVVTPKGFSERGWYGSEGMARFPIRAPRSIPVSDNAYDSDHIRRLSEADVLNVLAEVQQQYNVDGSRVYLMGQSMGGGGTWYLGTKHADIWAALAPLSPAISENPDLLEHAAHLPVMVVAGDADREVDVNDTRRWVAKMEELGMEYVYLEVAGGSHSGSGRENLGKVFEFLSKHKK